MIFCHMALFMAIYSKMMNQIWYKVQYQTFTKLYKEMSALKVYVWTEDDGVSEAWCGPWGKLSLTRWNRELFFNFCQKKKIEGIKSWCHSACLNSGKWKCELSGQHEENGLPEIDCDVFSFFLSVYLHKKQQQRHC